MSHLSKLISSKVSIMFEVTGLIRWRDGGEGKREEMR